MCTCTQSFYYRPQTKLQEGNVFTPVCDSVHGRWVSVRGNLCPGALCPGGLCPGESLSRGSLSGDLCQRGLCPGSSLIRESLSGGICPGVSVQAGLCPEGLFPGGSLSRGSLSGDPLSGCLCQGDRQRPLYSKEQVVHILLEYILVPN